MACLMISMDICFLPCVLVCFFLFPRPFCLVSLGQYYFSKSKAHADDALVIKGYHLKCSVSGSMRRQFAFDLLTTQRQGCLWTHGGQEVNGNLRVKVFFIFFFLAPLCTMWDLSFLTRDRSHTLCSRSPEP